MAKTLEERFWEKVEKQEDGCWVWTGCKFHNGYGRFRVNDIFIGAHRMAWILSVGTIPLNYCICHCCNVPSCVNPKHLFLGTQTQNLKDMHQKGRGRGGSLAGQSNPSSKLINSDIKKIRALNGKIPHERLGKLFSVSRSTIQNIIYRKCWKHI